MVIVKFQDAFKETCHLTHAGLKNFPIRHFNPQSSGLLSLDLLLIGNTRLLKTPALDDFPDMESHGDVHWIASS